LQHIKNIRGDISAKYSEFIWHIPDGFDDYLLPTKYLDSSDPAVHEMALKIVDGAENVQTAVLSILHFVRDIITQKISGETLPIKASQILLSGTGGCISKTILAAALARAVSIPSRLYFANITRENLERNYSPYELAISNLDTNIQSATSENTSSVYSLAWPEFYINEEWISAQTLFMKRLDTSGLFDRFNELGITESKILIEPHEWKQFPIADSKFDDCGAYIDPEAFFATKNYTPLPAELVRRLFGGFIYTGNLMD
ncbi:MAG: transglutaminase family protein, partial [Thermoplasmata archaeon]|nr:transglutaminase family protein [Thermoplasmata archaeon]